MCLVLLMYQPNDCKIAAELYIKWKPKLTVMLNYMLKMDGMFQAIVLYMVHSTQIAIIDKNQCTFTPCSGSDILCLSYNQKYWRKEYLAVCRISGYWRFLFWWMASPGYNYIHSHSYCVTQYNSFKA